MFKNSQEIITVMTNNSIEDYRSDYAKRENSNFVYSLSLLRHNIDNFEEEEYLMNNIFSPELKNLYRDGVIYVHDKKLAPYCNSLSAMSIANNGIPTLAKNMLASSPTKRLRKLFRHFSNAVILMSQQASGAVMISQATDVISSYLYYEEKVKNRFWTHEELKEEFQSLIWELNLPLRAGNQSPFSNITLQFGKASGEIENDLVMIGDVVLDIKYKNIPSEYFNRVNKAFIDAMSEGSNGIPFSFPLITVQITDDFDFDNEGYLYALEKMYLFGGMYHENFTTKAFGESKFSKVNPLIKPRDPNVSRSLCCRLNIDLEMLSEVGGGVFGSSTGNTGAVQVINANMNRLLLEYKYIYKNDYDKFLNERLIPVFEEMELNHQKKREWILDNKELYPTFFAFNKDLKNYFNVFAISGMHEGLINLGFDDGINNDEGKIFAHKILQDIHSILKTFIKRDKVACGLEYAPKIWENAA